MKRICCFFGLHEWQHVTIDERICKSCQRVEVYQPTYEPWSGSEKPLRAQEQLEELRRTQPEVFQQNLLPETLSVHEVRAEEKEIF